MSAPDPSALRILQVIETGGPGGAETVFVELSDELRKRGHAVSAIVGGEGWLGATLRERGIATESHRSRKSLDAATIRLFTDRIRRSRAQVVHAHLFGGALYAGIAGALCHVPVVVTLHGQVDVKEAGWRMMLKRQVLRRTATRVVAVSETLQRDLAPSLRLRTRASAVIANGVRHAAAPVAKRDAGARTHGALLVAIGNIRQPKGYPVLVDAVARLVPRFPDIRLRIAGQPDSGSLMQELEAQVERLGLRDHVEFLGFVADPSPLLQAADCFVLASYREGFSLATIEAMLAGTPVVATRSGGPEEILTDGDTGVLVPASDAAALADGIARVLSSPAESAAMARRARESAAQRYSLAAMVDQYEALYRQVITER